MSLKSAVKTAVSLLFPEYITCICCGDELNRETPNGLCPKCVLPANDEYCETCGRRIENLARFCDVCMKKRWEFDIARSAFVFDGNAVKLVYGLKFGQKGYLAKYMAPYLLDAYLSADFAADIITYVPLHKSRQRKRGYNQSELLAKEFSLLSFAPYAELLHKHTKTKPLSKLNAAKRAKAIAGCMSLTQAGKNLKGINVVLIDDMFTTGTTANECARLLREGGAESVMVLTFASAQFKPDLY